MISSPALSCRCAAGSDRVAERNPCPARAARSRLAARSSVGGRLGPSLAQGCHADVAVHNCLWPVSFQQPNESRTMKNNSRPGPLPPLRVRQEPPTVDEAVAAAQGLTDDPQEQAEIAAGLMGMSEEEVRPYVAKALKMQRAPQRIIRQATSARPRQTVVVERRMRSRSRAPVRRIEQPR